MALALALNWIRPADISQVPVGAVLAGCDGDGDDVYVGRVWQTGTTWTVVTIIPAKGIARGLRNDGPFESTEAEFLFGPEFSWSDDHDQGEIPRNAVATDDDNTIYIGRYIDDDDWTTVGEIRPDEGYIFLYGILPQEEYQALCVPPQEPTETPDLGDDNWELVSLQDLVPTYAVQAGQDDEGYPLYVARIWHRGDLVPGVIVGTTTNPPQVERISVPWGCVENLKDRGMILTGTGYAWQACEHGNVPEGAVQAGVTVNDEPLYAGRVNHLGQTIPGKIHPSHHVLYIGWTGRELNFRQYEVLVTSDEHNRHEWKTFDCKEPLPVDVVRAGPLLVVGREIGVDYLKVVSIGPDTQSVNLEYLCGTGFRWSKVFKDGNIPTDAMPAGYSQGHGMLYIGRGTYEGKSCVGGISTVERCMLLHQNGKSVTITDYEVLQHSWAKGKQAVHRIEPENTEPQGFKWVECKLRDLLPDIAVPVGWDQKESADSYVGRFWSQGEVLPASVVVNDDQRCVSASALQRSKTVRSNLFQVLTGPGFGWQQIRDNAIPSDAVTSGKCKTGENLYIGRKLLKNYLVPTRIQWVDGRAMVGHDGQLVEIRDVEVLTFRSLENSDDSHRWASSTINQPLPERAVFVGLDADGSEIYAGRLVHENMSLPANIIPKRRMAVASINDYIVHCQTYDVLIGTKFAWVDCINGQVPPNAIKLLSYDGQDDTYMGRVQNNKCLKLGRVSSAQRCLFVPHIDAEHRHSHYQALVKLTNEEQSADGFHWIAMDGTQKTTVPLNVVPSKNNEGSSFVGRLFYEGEFLPAEVTGNLKLAVAVFENSVVTSTKFEVLTGTSFSWEPSSDGGVPSGALASGKTLYGEWLFIGRATDNNHVRIGKVHPSHGRIYVPHNSKAKTYQNYEVLVQQKPTPLVVPMVEGETSGKCCVCWENEATMAVVPCGNLCLCCQCCQNPLLDRCPVCRGPKLHCIRIFKT